MRSTTPVSAHSARQSQFWPCSSFPPTAASGSTTAVGPSGLVLLVASPALPGLAALTAQGAARPVPTPRPIGGFRVWAVAPGARVLGVQRCV